MILTVYLSDGEQAVTEVPITPETTCRDVVEFCKEPGESGCHLAEVWRGNGKSWLKRGTVINTACFFFFFFPSDKWRNSGADLWLGEVTCHHSPLHCQGRFPHRPSDLLPSQSCWLISIFCWGATPLSKTTSQNRAVFTHVTHTHWAGAWYCGHLPQNASVFVSICFSFWMAPLKMSPFIYPSVMRH